MGTEEVFVLCLHCPAHGCTSAPQFLTWTPQHCSSHSGNGPSPSSWLFPPQGAISGLTLLFGDFVCFAKDCLYHALFCLDMAVALFLLLHF